MHPTHVASSQNRSTSQDRSHEDASHNTEETRSSGRLGEPRTLQQQIKASKIYDRQARIDSGEEGPSSGPFISSAQRAYRKQKGTAKIDPAALATLKRVAYEAALEKKQNRFGFYSKQVRVFQWAYRHRRPEPEYSSDADSHFGLSVQEQDEALAREIEQDQEQLDPHRPAEEVTEVSEQDRAEDAEVRRRIAETAEDPSYAAALQRGSPKQHQTRAADRQVRPAHITVSGQQSDRIDPSPSGRQNSPGSPDTQETINKMRASIHAAEQNVLHMQAAKRRTIEIPPQINPPRSVRPSPPQPVHVNPMDEEQLDYGDGSDEDIPDAEPLADASVQHASAAPIIDVQNRFAPIAPETHNRPTQQPPQNRSVHVPQNRTAHHAAPPAAQNRFAHHAAQPAAQNRPEQPAAQLPAAATTASLDADDYFDLPFEQLRSAQKQQIKKGMPAAVYQTFDEFSKNQDNTATLWVDSFQQRLINNSINPDHAVRFLSHEHLGNSTARTLAQWVVAHPCATFLEFRTALLALNPGKPPQVTRQTWKGLHMKNSGTYHAYLQEFTRQKALINTGPDEVVEQFLFGLTAPLRQQVEFLKNRNLKAEEFSELVHATTERVNSSAASSPEQSSNTPKIQNSSKRGRSESRGTNAGAHQNRSKSRQAVRHIRPKSKGFVGRTPAETTAISEYCFQNNICKICKQKGHRYLQCPDPQQPIVPFKYPAGWNEKYWINQNNRSAANRESKK